MRRNPAIVLVLVLAINVMANPPLDVGEFLGDGALRAGRLPADRAGVDVVTKSCIDGVDAYLATTPKEGVAPQSVRDALRFLAYYPHPAAADLAWQLSVAPLLTFENKSGRPEPYSPETPYAAHSHDAASRILVALGDPAAADLVIDAVVWNTTWVEFTINTLADVPGERSQRFLADLAVNQAIADSLEAESRRQASLRGDSWYSQRDQFFHKASKIRDQAQRALRRHDLAEQGLACPFDLPDMVVDRLVDQGLAISDEVANEHFELIEPEYPFITTDAIWHVFMRQSAAIFDALEATVLRDLLAEVSAGLAHASARQAAHLDDPGQVDLAWKNVVVAIVAARLLGVDDLPTLSTTYAQMVDEELALVLAAAGPSYSPTRGRPEDYAAYRPRGRHSDPATDQDWYRAMTWWGRFTWRFNDAEERQQALLLCSTLDGDSPIREQWIRFDGLITIFFGRADDPTPLEVLDVAETITRKSGSEAIEVALADPVMSDEVEAALMVLPAPTVNTDVFALPLDDARGMRLFGLRSTEDSMLFQQLLNSECWPVSGLDVASEFFNSSRAHELRDTQLREQPTQHASWKQVVAAPDGGRLNASTVSLNSTGLDLLAGLFDTPLGVPPSLQTKAWQDKQINTALSAWCELRHVTHLFVKEAHSSWGLSTITSGFHGYVEPYPDFYSGLRELTEHLRLAADLCGLWSRIDELPAPVSMSAWKTEHPAPNRRELLAQGLSHAQFDELQKTHNQAMNQHRIVVQQRQYMPSPARLSDLEDLLDSLEDLARRELAGLPQTPADCRLLRTMKVRLQHLSYNEGSALNASQPMSCVIDVAHYGGSCLEVAVGRPRALYVVVDVGPRRQVCRGSISTYHEFTRPGVNRLDDGQWRLLEGTTGFEPWILQQPTFR